VGFSTGASSCGTALPVTGYGVPPMALTRGVGNTAAGFEARDFRSGTPRERASERKPLLRGPCAQKEENYMRTILLIVLVLLILGALPTWPYSAGWGYYPSGGLGLVLVILLILAVLGKL
jgi:hypothetical protein